MNAATPETDERKKGKEGREKEGEEKEGGGKEKGGKKGNNCSNEKGGQ